MKIRGTAHGHREAGENNQSDADAGDPARAPTAIGSRHDRREAASGEDRERKLHFHQMTGWDTEKIEDRNSVDQPVEIERCVAAEREKESDHSNDRPKSRSAIPLQDQ